MDYQLSGKVKVITEPQTFKSGFMKREFVVTVEDGKFPQDIKLECVKDRCALLDDVSEGDEVTAHFNIRGNEYNGRYYVNLQAWKLEKGAGGGTAADDNRPADLDEPPPGFGNEEDDGIPF